MSCPTINKNPNLQRLFSSFHHIPHLLPSSRHWKLYLSLLCSLCFGFHPCSFLRLKPDNNTIPIGPQDSMTFSLTHFQTSSSSILELGSGLGVPILLFIDPIPFVKQKGDAHHHLQWRWPLENFPHMYSAGWPIMGPLKSQIAFCTPWSCPLLASVRVKFQVSYTHCIF